MYYVLIHKCAAFEKVATLQEDMAKRIMLSIIPAVQSPLETHITKGFDYKALKSAVSGVNDLIKYGIRACVMELKHYGNTYLHAEQPNTELRNKCKKEYIEIKNIMESEPYQCIVRCNIAFSNADAWEPTFGGKAWLQISTILQQLYIQRDNLTKLRANGQNFPDFLNKEIKLMKDIIINMNIFDGLAHNTEEVMTNLIEEEHKDIFKDKDLSNKDLTDFYFQKSKDIRRLMDTKELQDPIAVYKQVQDIIEEPHNKYLFKDYIHNIRQHPNYNQVSSEISKTQHTLARIRAKKELRDNFININYDLDKLYKESLSNDKQEFIVAIAMLKDNIQYICNVMKLKNILSDTDISFFDSIFNEINLIKNNLYDVSALSPTERTSIYHKVKKLANSALDKLREYVNI